jgi:hypothetical protein
MPIAPDRSSALYGQHVLQVPDADEAPGEATQKVDGILAARGFKDVKIVDVDEPAATAPRRLR